VNNGTFSEGLNLAGAFNLPVIVVVENNQYAVSTPVEQATREPELYKRGIGCGVESYRMDGNDVLEVYEHARRAVESCTAGKGPVLLEALTYRHAGHHVNDPGQYMPEDKLNYYKEHDPCILGRRYLLEQGSATEAEIDALEERVRQRMEEAVAFGEADTQPDLADFLQAIEEYT
jgi:pyruvate dehydrogenase E1 component alpha subunit